MPALTTPPRNLLGIALLFALLLGLSLPMALPFSLPLSAQAPTPTHLFSGAMGGISGDAGNSVAVDAAGNVWVTGSFSGTIDFDPGSGVTNLTSTGSGDIFLAKYSPTGGLLFAGSMGGTSRVAGHSVAVDTSGNVWVTGDFEHTVDFDLGPGVANLTAVGFEGMFLAKYSPTGGLLFAGRMGGANTRWTNGHD